MNKNTIAIVIAALLVGGVSVAAFQRARSPDTLSTNAAMTAEQLAANGDLGVGNQIPADGRAAYADVINVAPIIEKEDLYATVIGTDPVRETTTSSTPREVCNDVVVQERLPERDGNVGGAVAGALIGGLVGNQVGSGRGRRLATVAGAVGGGFAGREIDRRHVGGRVASRTERECHTVSESSQSSQVVAYNVTYRNPDGTTGTMRTGSKPGERIALGSEDRTIGYDVTYRYDGQERTIRMDQKPGARLPVINGQIVTQTASVSGDAGNG
ncbi:MAG: glycine zipper 2TM domain-containing protein [Luteimonas sp.]